MTSTLNLSLTDELRAFIDNNSGDGTLYSTPSEFMRDIIREKKAKLEAKMLRDGIIEGYQDVISGRHIVFNGSLSEVMQEAEKREKHGW